MARWRRHRGEGLKGTPRTGAQAGGGTWWDWKGSRRESQRGSRRVSSREGHPGGPESLGKGSEGAAGGGQERGSGRRGRGAWEEERADVGGGT